MLLWLLFAAAPEVVVPGTHRGVITSLVMSRAGDVVATSASSDPEIRLWDMRGRRASRSIVMPGNQPPSAIALSPSGDTLVAYYSREFFFYDLKTDAAPLSVYLRLPSMGSLVQPSSLAFADDKTLIAVQDGIIARIGTDGKVQALFEDVDKNPWRVAFSPNGKFVAVHTMGQKLQLYDLDAKTTKTLSDEGIARVTFDPKSERVVAVTDKQTLTTYDVKTGALSGTTAFPSHVKQGYDGLNANMIWFRDHDLYVMVGGFCWKWDARTKNAPVQLDKNWEAARPWAVTGDGKRLVMYGGGRWFNEYWMFVELDTDDIGKGIEDVDGLRFKIPDASAPRLLGAGDALLLPQRYRREAHLWNLASGEDLMPARAFDVVKKQNMITSSAGHFSLVFTPDGLTLIDVNARTFTPWADTTAYREDNQYLGDLLQPQFSPDEKYVALMSRHEKLGQRTFGVTVRDRTSGKQLFEFYDEAIDLKVRGQSCEFSADSTRLVCPQQGKFARILSVPDGKTIGVVAIEDLFVSGSYILGRNASAYTKMAMYDARDGKDLTELLGAAQWVNASPDGKWLAMSTAGNQNLQLQIMRLSDKSVRTVTNGGCTTAWASQRKYFTADSATLVQGCPDQLIWVDVATATIRSRAPSPAKGATLGVQVLGKWVLTFSPNTGTGLWKDGKLIANVLASDDDYVMITPDGYYMSSKGPNALIAFRVGDRTYPFDQFDLYLNRPDIVLERMGADKTTVALYKRARDKRIERLGGREPVLADVAVLPRVRLLDDGARRTKALQIPIKVRVQALATPVERFNLFINGVRIIGEAMTVAPNSTIEKTFNVELAARTNVIQVSAEDSLKRESLRDSYTIYAEGKHAAPNLYVLSIGVSDYVNDDLDLRYAAKDAKDLASVLSTDNAAFAKVFTKIILDHEVTRESVAAAKTFLQDAQVEDEVLLFVAGHGFLDAKDNYYFATSDVDIDKPEARGVPYSEIEGLFEGLKARKKLALIDTCHSGEVDKDELRKTLPQGVVLTRGIKKKTATSSGTNTNVSRFIGEVFADLRRDSGATVLTSSSGVQLSLESGEYKNGVFTYSVIEGMRNRAADANGDGAVGVSELRDYVGQRVGELTQGLQTPSLRRENFEGDYYVYAQHRDGYGNRLLQTPTKIKPAKRKK